MPLGLGIDIGTTNSKVALVGLDRPELRVLAVATAATPAPDRLRDSLIGLIGRVLSGGASPDVVGIASMAETGVPLGPSGTPLGPWLRWNAHEAGAEAETLAARLGRDALIDATGVRPSAKVPLARWAWLRAHRPDDWRAMTAWSGVADLAGYLLTGRLTTDHTLAGRTMAYRLPAAGEPLATGFDADLLTEVGLRPGQLPAVVPPDAIAGRVSDPAFVACGLRSGTPVVVAGHDHAVGAYACGVREPGDVANSVGTAEVVMTVVAGHPDPVTAGRAGMSTVVTVGGRHRAILAGSSSAGATIGWWLEHEPGGADVFDAVLASGDEPTGVIVLPYLAGRQTPAPDPAARLRVIGRRPSHRPEELARALLEGLCLQTRWMLTEQARLTGGNPAPGVHLFGGPVAANPAWLRVRSRVLPGGLRVVREAEAVAAGAAVVAAARAGLTGLPALGGQRLAPAGDDYAPMFARFVAAATGTQEDPR